MPSEPESSDDFGGGWNYRMVRQRSKGAEADTYGEWRFGIHEVYYKTDHTLSMMTVEEVGPNGETEEELRKSLKLYLLAFEKPVLTFPDDFPEGADDGK